MLRVGGYPCAEEGDIERLINSLAERATDLGNGFAYIPLGWDIIFNNANLHRVTLAAGLYIDPSGRIVQYEIFRFDPYDPDGWVNRDLYRMESIQALGLVRIRKLPGSRTEEHHSFELPDRALETA
ncbi:hypothetical protein J4475_00405 [Candidatus Woesearchaeota archaeon]|nr:hypothetical protein [Candidatus Woesearchaeota archaeon]